ncbi:MAG: transcription elongation factor GreA [Rhodospirillales bacterium]|nr:transcription elongation factor GreA [Rhodospirillales bacterium]
MDRIPMTADGFAALERELKMLKGTERPAIIKAIATAREHGDLKENAEYHAARERQSFVEGRIAELEGVISHVEVIDPATMSGTVVRFGASVLVYDESADEEVTYTLVGSHETDISQMRISITAPLARALLGKTIGDVVEVTSPGGTKSYEVCDVRFD